MTTFDRVTSSAFGFGGFALAWFAATRLEDVGQMVALVFGCSLMSLSGYIRGRSQGRW